MTRPNLFFKDLKIFVDLDIDLDGVLIADGIFTEEIKVDKIGSFQFDVFITKRAAANRISFIIPFFIPCSEGQSINQVHGSGTLTGFGGLIHEISSVACTDLVDMFLVKQEKRRL